MLNRYTYTPTPSVKALPSVVSINKGGTSGSDEISTAQSLGVVSLYSLGIPLGVAKLGADGFIPSAQLPSSIITGPTIDGPDEVFVNQTVQFVITNYDIATNYTITVSDGVVSRTNDIITYTAPSVSKLVTMNVNGKECKFQIDTIAPLMPVITSPVQFALERDSSVVITTAALSMPNAETVIHQITDWQVATNAEFTTIVKFNSNDSVNKVTWTVTGLNANQGYFVRARFRAIDGRYSKWSNLNYFRTKTVF